MICEKKNTHKSNPNQIKYPKHLKIEQSLKERGQEIKQDSCFSFTGMHKKTADPADCKKESSSHCLKSLKEELNNLGHDEQIKQEAGQDTETGSTVDEEEFKENCRDEKIQEDEDVDVENNVSNDDDEKSDKANGASMEIEEKDDKTNDLDVESTEDGKSSLEAKESSMSEKLSVKKTLKNLLNQEQLQPIVKSGGGRKPRRKKNANSKQSPGELTFNGRSFNNHDNHYLNNSLNFASPNQSDELEILRSNSIAQLRAKALEHSAKVLHNTIYSNLSQQLNSSSSTSSSPNQQQANQNELNSSPTNLLNQLPKSTNVSPSTSLANSLHQSNSIVNMNANSLSHNAAALTAALSAAASTHSNLAAYSGLTAHQQLSIYNNIINTPLAAVVAASNQGNNHLINREENSTRNSPLLVGDNGTSLLNGFGQRILY